MPNYRRAGVPGGSYFFTVVTHNRQPLLTTESFRFALREAINEVRKSQPFEIDAWVLLPDHMHCMWTLPEGDQDFSKRWGRIKAGVVVDAVKYSELNAVINKLGNNYNEPVDIDIDANFMQDTAIKVKWNFDVLNEKDEFEFKRE